MLASVNLPFVGSWSQIIVLVMMVLIAYPALRSRIKDQTIKDLNEALKGCREAASQSAEESKKARDEAEQCRLESAQWRAKYEEQTKYTAGPAIDHFERMMADHTDRVASRHEAMLAHLELQTEAHKNLAELVGHSVVIAVAVARKLGAEIPPP